MVWRAKAGLAGAGHGVGLDGRAALMVARLSAAEAKKLGIDTKVGAKRRVRRSAKGPYHTVCKCCGEHFHQRAAEDEHLDRTRHPNYLLVWD